MVLVVCQKCSLEENTTIEGCSQQLERFCGCGKSKIPIICDHRVLV